MVSVISGVVCCFAQLGSFDISIALGLTGVPVYVTLPVTVPAPGTAAANAAIESAAINAVKVFRICILICMLTSLMKLKLTCICAVCTNALIASTGGGLNCLQLCAGRLEQSPLRTIKVQLQSP